MPECGRFVHKVFPEKVVRACEAQEGEGVGICIYNHRGRKTRIRVKSLKRPVRRTIAAAKSDATALRTEYSWSPRTFSTRLESPHPSCHSHSKDIRQLDFLALRRAGYRGAVFDKDNCLTIPYKDTLVPQLVDAWKECREVFGEGNVLIVSNSAGTKHDAGQIQAESVSYHLSVPVLRCNSPKPAYSCIKSIRGSTLRDPIKDEERVIVGDRVFTNVVMANRMRRRLVHGPGWRDGDSWQYGRLVYGKGRVILTPR